MNTLNKIFFCLAMLLFSCSDYEIPGTYDVTVKVAFPEQFTDNEALSGIAVKATNVQTGREYIGTTDNTGVAHFSLRGGNYNIMISFSGEREVEIDGYMIKKTVLFNGSINGQLITTKGNEFPIQLQYSISSEGFVIKELYCSGSKTPQDKSYGADKFFEIYNNSDKVLYSDGLCFGMVSPHKTYIPTPYVDENGKLLDRIPVWSFVAIVPGSGEEHPIQPGKSFVVALSALNHRDDPNGNPNSIDLSMANWELCVEHGYYPDVPSVPNMLMQRITIGNAMAFNQSGTVCILFRLPSNDYQSIFTNTENFYQAPGSSFNCFMVPKAWVIDGVENAILDDRGVYKRLPNEIDVGYIQFRGSLEGVSIKRKVSEVIDGRTVYKDTNNSAEDFLTNQIPTPGIIATK
jgi:hypothetical protein